MFLACQKHGSLVMARYQNGFCKGAARKAFSPAIVATVTDAPHVSVQTRQVWQACDQKGRSSQEGAALHAGAEEQASGGAAHLRRTVLAVNHVHRREAAPRGRHVAVGGRDGHDEVVAAAHERHVQQRRPPACPGCPRWCAPWPRSPRPSSPVTSARLSGAIPLSVENHPLPAQYVHHLHRHSTRRREQRHALPRHTTGPPRALTSKAVNAAEGSHASLGIRRGGRGHQTCVYVAGSSAARKNFTSSSCKPWRILDGARYRAEGLYAGPEVAVQLELVGIALSPADLQADGEHAKLLLLELPDFCLVLGGDAQDIGCQ